MGPPFGYLFGSKDRSVQSTFLNAEGSSGVLESSIECQKISSRWRLDVQSTVFELHFRDLAACFLQNTITGFKQAVGG